VRSSWLWLPRRGCLSACRQRGYCQADRVDCWCGRDSGGVAQQGRRREFGGRHAPEQVGCRVRSCTIVHQAMASRLGATYLPGGAWRRCVCYPGAGCRDPMRLIEMACFLAVILVFLTTLAPGAGQDRPRDRGLLRKAPRRASLGTRRCVACPSNRLRCLAWPAQCSAMTVGDGPPPFHQRRFKGAQP